MAKITLTMQNDSGEEMQSVTYSVNWYTGRQLFAQWARTLQGDPEMPEANKSEKDKLIKSLKDDLTTCLRHAEFQRCTKAHLLEACKNTISETDELEASGGPCVLSLGTVDKIRTAIAKAESKEPEGRSVLADDELNEFVALARYFIKWLPDLADHFHNLGMTGAEVEVEILSGKAKMLLKKYKHPPLDTDRQRC